MGLECRRVLFRATLSVYSYGREKEEDGIRDNLVVGWDGKIGRTSYRERVEIEVDDVSLKKKIEHTKKHISEIERTKSIHEDETDIERDTKKVTKNNIT